MRHKVVATLMMLFALTVLTVSCEEDEVSPGKRSPDWSAETHEKTDSPDYDLVFGDEDGIDEDEETPVVKRIDITISPSEWNGVAADMQRLYGVFGKDRYSENPSSPSTAEELMAQIREEQPVWRSCTVGFNGLTWTHVGIRIKGSQSSDLIWRKGIWKLPFELDFDVHGDARSAVAGQRFHGFDSLILSNNLDDDSLIREKTAADVFRRAGVPAPAAAFCRLYIDMGDGPTYFGLYTLVEGIGDAFLNRYYGNEDGNLYAPNAKFSEVFDEALYLRKNNSDDDDYSDVKTLYDAINLSRGFTELWKTNLEAVFDVDGFVRWLAANAVMQNWNTYGVMENNFTLYYDTVAGLFRWIPANGNNSAILPGGTSLNATSLSLDNVDEAWPFIRFIMDHFEYRDKYLQYIENMVDGEYSPAAMAARFQEAHDLITPYVIGDDGENEGYTHLEKERDFTRSLSLLNGYVSFRYEDVKELVFYETSK